MIGDQMIYDRNTDETEPLILKSIKGEQFGKISDRKLFQTVH